MSQAQTIPATARRWRFGKAELDERSLVLKVDGRAVAIEPKPLEVLICLLERAGEVVTKDALMRAAWPGRIIADVTLAKTLARLREALGDKDQSLIKTQHRYGYRLIAPVKVETLDRADAARKTQDLPEVVRRDTEHRPLTVLFCDVVESTQLADTLEPEVFRELLVNYQRRAADICARYEGHLAPQAGDGLLMYFGYPAAHDDDAERALRCACELISSPAQDASASRLALRVGVHTSTVLIGCTGSGSEPLATGAGLHLAARLQALAEPDTVLMSEATFRLVPGLFVTRDFGPQSIRGLSEPVSVHQAIQPSGVRTRLEAAARLTPYAGRESEIETLGKGWQAAVRGEGRALMISGEPGLGKSRLLLELRERLLSGAAFTWLECRASALTRHSTWQPWVELLRRGLNLRDGDTDGQGLQRLEHSLGIDASVALPLLAPLLGLALPAHHAGAQLGPELRRRRTLEALVNWVLHSAQQQPLVLVFEDLHWADDSSLDCLGLLLKQLADMPVLLLMTARTEFVPRWLQHPWLHFLTLDPLPVSGVDQMLATLGEGRALSAESRALVHQRAGGVPLFVEELTRSLLESADAEPAREPQAIPTSLRALLMARLDRLGPARDLMQIAAVVGREVSHALLAQVAGLDDTSLLRALRRLTDSGMLHARGSVPDATYVFKHALIQDAAYETLVKSRRQHWHGQIAQALEAQFPERARNEPEVLALHFEKAGLIEAAVRYGSRAADKAIAASAYVEAIRHAEHALQLLPRAEKVPASAPLELQLLVTLGSAKLALLGRGHPELVPIMERSETLYNAVRDGGLQARALVNIALTRAGIGDYPGYARSGEQLVAHGRGAGNRAWEGVGHNLATQARHFMGEFQLSMGHIEQAERAFENQPPDPAIRVMGLDGLTVALGFKAYMLWLLGRPDQARDCAVQLLARAQSTGHPQTIGAAKSRAAWQAIFRREPQPALELAHAGAAFSERHGFSEWQSLAQLQAGIATGLLDRFEEAITLVRNYQPSPKLMRFLFGSLARGFEAQFCLAAGRLCEARAALDAAFLAVQQSRELHWESELHRLHGELTLAEHSDDCAAAETCFRKALGVARHQEARSLELRAATSLARLWLRAGRAEEADAVLRPIYAGFTEGFDTPDLIDAAALLQQAPKASLA
ncbi:MAG: AAA family ATPase [Panacagrimonas sp.]